MYATPRYSDGFDLLYGFMGFISISYIIINKIEIFFQKSRGLSKQEEGVLES